MYGWTKSMAALLLTQRSMLDQPLAGMVSSEDITLGAGFWHGGVNLEEGSEIYLPLVRN
jgi:hypothetical protein